MKEEHVNETDEEINSIKRQIFLGGWKFLCVANLRTCARVCVSSIRGSCREKCARRRGYTFPSYPLLSCNRTSRAESLEVDASLFPASSLWTRGINVSCNCRTSTEIFHRTNFEHPFRIYHENNLVFC